MKRSLELIVQFVTIASILTYLVELEFGPEHHPAYKVAEWAFGLFFIAEYVVRWIKSGDLKYPLRPMAIVDLLAIVPLFAEAMFGGLRALRLIRTIRLFRLFKLFRNSDIAAVRDSFRESLPTLKAVFVLAGMFVVFSATAIYEVERYAQPDTFNSFSDAVWWSLVTMTTVGYGDLYPKTAAGRTVAMITIVFGIAIFSSLFSVLQAAFTSAKMRHTAAENSTQIDRLERMLTDLHEKYASKEAA